MSLLEKIIVDKQKEVQKKKSLYPIKKLEKSIYFSSSTISLKQRILENLEPFSIIAEFKRKSPSKGVIHENAKIEEVIFGYMQAGACALSILTDEKYFGAKPNDLSTASYWSLCPILRKDFIIEDYQIYEAKAIGADAILLIARILSFKQIQDFTQTAHQLGMEVLLEFHDELDIQKCADFDDYHLAGINHRNLDTLHFDFENSLKLYHRLPPNIPKIAESGIHEPQTLLILKQIGYHGFLIGEYFMKSHNPGQTCKNLLKEAKQLWETTKSKSAE